MASYPELRRTGSRPAAAGRFGVRGTLLPLVLLAVAGLAALQLAGHGRPSRTVVPVALPPSVLLEKPALGAKLDIDRHGLVVTSGRSSFSLAFESRHGTWRRIRAGVQRVTPYGLEQITLGTNRAEQSVRVDRRQGTRTWRWHLKTTRLTPTLSADGSVRFEAGSKDAGLRILPVKIFDRAGKDVTPRGLRWSLRSGRLELRLDDARLPVPYVIDPIALVGNCNVSAAGNYAGCDVRTTSSGATLTFTRPTAVSTGTLMLAQVSIRNNSAITKPSGWTQIGNLRTSGAGIEQALYYRVADATDTSGKTYQWSWTGSVDAAGGLLAYSGVDTTDPFDGTPTDNANTSLTATATGLTTTQNNDMLVPLYSTVNNVTLTQNTGESMTQEYTAISGSSGRDRVTGSDGTLASPGASGNKTAAISASGAWVAHLAALEPPLSADGSGTLTVPNTSVSASSTGNTLTFTYTAATGGINNGSVTLAVPSGWSAPSTTGANAGYTTSSKGTVSVAGQTITVGSLTLAGGATMTITYGDTSGGGPGATAGSTTGSPTWQSQEKSRSTGTLTNLGSSPSNVTVYAADGSGTLTVPNTSVSASSTGNTLTFTYTAATGGLSSGSVTLAVPSGWSAPSTSSAANGYTTSSTGSVSVSSQTITVSGMTLSGGSTMVITYGSKAGGGAGATAASTTGSPTWQAQEKSTSNATSPLANLASSPSNVTVYAADGSGTLTTSTSNVSASSNGKTLTFTYTAATGGLSSGSVTVVVPSGWSAPSTTGSANGYTTSSTGSVSVSSQTITVSGVTLAGGSTMTITYGDKSNGGSGATATSSTGAATWQAQEKSTSNSTSSLTNLGSSPSVTVNAADGSGTLTTPTTNVSASATGKTIVFTYTAASGGTSSGSVTIDVPSGWSAPSTTGSANGYTTSSAGTVSASGQTITVSGLTLSGGSTATITYGDTGSGGSGATVTSSTGAQTWSAKEKSVSAGSLTGLGSSPLITVNAADGSGTVTTPTTNVSASATGRTIVFTYTAATGGISGGSVTVDVPSGWSAPSTSASANGYTTSSAGTVSVSGQTITVSSLTLSGGSTATITYGDTSGGGSGATVTSSTGSQTWSAKEKSTGTGSVASLGSSPSVTVNAADGSGTLTTPTTNVSASATGKTIVFTYTAATGGISGGSLTVDVPSGWSAPSTTGSANGYTTSSAGTVSVSGQTITVSSLTLSAGSTASITYGDTGSGGSGATVSSSTGAQTWSAKEKSVSAASLTSLGSSPSITVNAADGSGTLTTPTTNVSASASGKTLAFTYTAAAGGLSGASVTIDVPSGWSAPSTAASANGYTTSNAGTVSVSGQTITVSSLTLSGGSTVTITYGDTSGGGSGATVTSSTGAQTWSAKEKSSGSGSLASLGASPSVTVNAADGTGTLTTPTTDVGYGSTGNRLVFTYSAGTGGLSNGAVTLAVPAGWSAPSTTASAAGYTTSSAGSVSVAGQTITVSGLTLAGGATATITYGDTSGAGPGATAASSTGSQTWQAKEKSTAAGSLTNLGSSPSVNVLSPDGSGTLTTPTSVVANGSASNTLTFTYTAAAGGISSGAVRLVVPAGWSAPSTTASANGYTTSSAGSVSVSGQTITVSGLTLSAGSTTTITYGDTSGGGSGATASSTAGAQSWQAKERSSSAGSLTDLASSPSVTILSADGSGTVTTPTNSVANGSTGNTVVFTFTAATGGISNGAIKIDVPAGWSAPSTAGTAAGYTTSSAGTVSVSGQTITVSGVTLAAGAALTITYGDTNGGSAPGATASTTAGSATWQTRERSSSGGSFTSLAASPNINVSAADGSGTLTTPTSSVTGGSTGNTIVFTYTAATGGSSNGSVTVDVPAGWSAPSTAAAANGYTRASTGSVSVSGRTITVSGLTLSGGSKATITYGDTTGGGFGATAASSVGSQTWQAEERSTGGGTLTSLASSPSISVTDSTPPSAPTLTLSAGANAYTVGQTAYYRTGAAGSFAVTASSDDPESGVASYSFPSLGTGWSGSQSGATETYSFNAAADPVEPNNVAATNGAGLTSNPTSFTVTADSTAPTTSIACSDGCGGWHTPAPVTITLTPSDSGSGVAQTIYTTDGSDPTTSPTAQVYAAPFTIGATTTVKFFSTDRVGNAEAVGSQTVDVDTTAPSAPSLSLNAGSNASVSGSTVYFRSGAAGSFDLTPSSTDSESGVASYGFPDLGSGWSRTVSGGTATYGFTSSAADPSEPNDVTATNNAGLTSSATSFTVTPDGTAPSTSIQCNGASCPNGWYSASPVSVTLSASDAGGSGVAQIKYTTDGSDPATSGTAVVYSGAFLVSGTSTTVRYSAADEVGNVEPAGQQTIQIDTTAPSAPSLTLHAGSNAYVSGSTVYFRSGAAGSFDVTAGSSDAQSGVASYSFPSLGNGWSGSQSGVAETYSFDAADDPSEPNDVTATNNAGLTSSATSFTVTADGTAPSTSIQCDGGACSAGWYSASPVSVTLAATDGGSGVASIKYTTDGSDPRSSATAVTYSGAFDVTGTSTSVKYSATDRVGDVEAVGQQTIRIDTTAPSAPSLSFGSFTNASATGSTVYVRTGAAGGFTVTGTSADGQSGVDHLTFPSLGSGWTGGGPDSSSPYQGVYSFDSSASAPSGQQDVTATNQAGLDSSATPFTVVADTTAPASSIECNGAACAGWYTTSPVSVTLAATDGGSGVAQIKYTTDGSDPATSGTAVVYSGAFDVAATTTVRHAAEDKVGNVESASSQLVQVDTTAPGAPSLTLSAGANAFVNGSTVYFRPGAAGSFDVSASSSDGESGIASYAFPSLGSGWSASGSGASRTYGFGASAVDPVEPNDVTAANNAGLSSSPTSFTVTADGAAPTTSISCSVGCGGWHTSAPVSITLSASDAGSGVAETLYTTDGSNPTTSPTAQVYAAPFTLSSTATVRFFSTDNLGNAEALRSQTVQIDTTAPSAPSLTLSAGANAYVSGSTVYFRSGATGSFDVSASSSDGESGVASYAFPSLGSGWSASGSGASRTYSFGSSGGDPSEPNDITATNNAGLTSGATSFTVTADGTAPNVTLDDPGSAMSGVVSLSATTSDAGSGVGTVHFEYAPAGTGSWTTIPATWDTTAVADGAYDLRAVATDKVGNQATSAVLTRVVDNTSLSVSITAPAAGAFLSSGDADPYTVTASASALSGVASVQFFECSTTSPGCSGGVWNSIGIDTAAPFQAAWTLPGDGNRALRAEAVDNTGHRSSDIVDVTVDLTAPTGSLTDPGANLRSTVGLAAAASDATSGVGSVSFQCSPAGADSWTTISTDTTAPYAGSFDTTAVPDGLYDLRVFVTDGAGNAAASTVVHDRRVDNTPPSATMGDPGPYVSGTVNLTSTGSDSGSGVAGVTYEYSRAGANSWTTTAAAWDTSGLADGAYDLRVIAIDNAGNSGTSASVTTAVDNSGPSTTQNDPGQYLRGTVTLSGSASDAGSGVTQVAFQVTAAGGSSWTTVGTDTTAPYSVQLDTTTLTDGLYDFRTVATDGAGNQSASAVVGLRRVDNTPPSATMIDPGANLRGTVTLTSAASDFGGSGVASVAYEYSQAGANNWTATPAAWGTTIVSDGLYDVRVIATDNAGNQTISAPVASRRVDNTAPATTDDAPAGWRASDVTVTLSPADAGSGVASTRYEVDSGSWQTGTSVVVPAPADGSNDGVHTITYYSTDNAGNVETAQSTTVRIDTTPPGGGLGDPGQYLRGTVGLTATPSDGGAGISSVVFEYSPAGANSWTTIATDSSAPWTASWDTTAAADGTYDLRAVFRDGATNQSVSTLTGKVVDNTAPSASLTAPADGQTISGNVAIGANASDATAGVALVQFRVKASGSSSFTTVGTDTTAPYSVSWDSTTAPDGPADLEAVATDRAGNVVTSSTRTITVDNVAPLVTLDDPGANIRGSVTLSASSSADTAQVAFQRSPAGANTWTTISTDTSAPFSVSFDTTAVADGGIELRAVATDGSGNVGTSPVRASLVDNTAPTGALTAPTGGSVVGGPSIPVSASADDGSGSGVAAVTFQFRPAGGGSWTDIATDSTAPWSVSWDSTALASGDYEVRAVVADAAGNSSPTTPVTVTADSTPPTITFDDPGSSLSGVATLTASTGGGATHVVFERRPVGGSTWTTIATDNAAPWSVPFDTTLIPDGLYDLRATAYDAVGNSAVDTHLGVRIDNTPPDVVSSTPADGAVVASASSISVTANEALSDVRNVTLDARPTAAPAVSGATASFATGALATGPHTLAGTLVDLGGETRFFLVHFTVWSGPAADVPYVEKNSLLATGTSLTSVDGAERVVMPGAAVADPGTGDWLVLRVDPSPALTSPAAGYAAASETVSVTARWAIAGTQVRQFQHPADVVITNTTGGPVTPGTWEHGGSWQAIRKVPTPGVLPAGWQDGYYADAAGVHIMTMHLSYFALLRDIDPPTPPQRFTGTMDSDGLTLSWAPGTDNSGQLDHFTLFVNGARYATYAIAQLSAKLGAFNSGDTRRFTLAESDAAGNESAQTKALRAVPDLHGLTEDQAKAALLASSFQVGTVQLQSSSTVPSGTVIAGSGVVLAEEGSAVDFVVSAGTAEVPLSLAVSAPKTFAPAKVRLLKARISLSRPAQVSATLLRGKKTVRTWRLTGPVGSSAVKLLMPRPLAAGSYTIVWVARADADTKQVTTPLRVLKIRAAHRGAGVAPSHRRAPVNPPPPKAPRPVEAASRPVAPAPAVKPARKATTSVHEVRRAARKRTVRPSHRSVLHVARPHRPAAKPDRHVHAHRAAPTRWSSPSRLAGILVGIAAVVLLAVFLLNVGGPRGLWPRRTRSH